MCQFKVCKIQYVISKYSNIINKLLLLCDDTVSGRVQKVPPVPEVPQVPFVVKCHQIRKWCAGTWWQKLDRPKSATSSKILCSTFKGITQQILRVF